MAVDTSSPAASSATPAARGGRHRVVVIGSGFGGLWTTEALAKAPVAVTVISQTSHHLFQPLLYQVATGVLSEGEVAPATREVLKKQANATVLLGRVTEIDLDRAHRHLAQPAGHDRDPVRHPGRGRRRRPVLLRQRPVLRVRPRDEEHRRRPGAARPDLRLVRAGRAVHRPGRDRGVADLRRGRRRPHRRRDGGPDRRAGAPDAAPGLPPDRHQQGPGDPAGRRPGGARGVRREAVHGGA